MGQNQVVLTHLIIHFPTSLYLRLDPWLFWTIVHCRRAADSAVTTAPTIVTTVDTAIAETDTTLV